MRTTRARVASSIILPIILWIASALNLTKSTTENTKKPPTYGPSYLPPFIRGIIAAINIGKDEDSFLVHLHRNYGPVVYIPWPLAQYFVTSGNVVQTVYDTPARILSFSPIRMSMQNSVMGSPPSVAFHSIMTQKLFPDHARALTKGKLDPPLARFVDSIRNTALASIATRLQELSSPQNSNSTNSIEINLVEWTEAAMFEAATVAMFGPEMLPTAGLTKSEFHRLFKEFDAAFPLLASGKIPSFMTSLIPVLSKGIKARNNLARHMSKWVDAGLPGMAEGMIRDMYNIGLSQSWSSFEIAQILVSECWAIQANAPSAAVWALVAISQSKDDDVLKDVLAEVDSVASSSSTLDMASLSTSVPLISSCIHETLRLSTSSFSVRLVEEPFFLRGGSQGKKDELELADSQVGWDIPKGSFIVCATRVSHLDESSWGKNVRVWDGRRFFDEAGMEGERSKRSREVRGFGGGISICEGRNLATAELKAFLVEVLSAFNFEPLHPIFSDGSVPEGPTPSTTMKIAGGKNAICPRVGQGRVGLGVHQFDGNDVRVRVSRRVQ
ncbi:cytochrome P450 [Meredithblackwellia eburnea MCA 4105]